MSEQLWRDELLQPLRAWVIPHLPLSALAMLRGSCRAAVDLVDLATESVLLAAAAELLPKGGLSSLPQPVSTRAAQLRLLAQASLEAQIRQGGPACGTATSCNVYAKACANGKVAKLEWSPCSNWVRRQLPASARNTMQQVHIQHVSADSALGMLPDANMTLLGQEAVWLAEPQPILLLRRASHRAEPGSLAVYHPKSRSLQEQRWKVNSTMAPAYHLSHCRRLLLWLDPDHVYLSKAYMQIVTVPEFRRNASLAIEEGAFMRLEIGSLGAMIRV